MKKRVNLILISLAFVLVFSLNFVSAVYLCSNGNLWSEDIGELKVQETRVIQGIGFGLIDSDESNAIGRHYANFVYDADKFILTDQAPSQRMDLEKGSFNITFLNLKKNIAQIKAKEVNDSIEVEEELFLGDFLVYLLTTSGVYPGTAKIEGFIGSNRTSLDNNNPIKKVKIKETEYIFELAFASDDTATIKVRKCRNPTDKIIEILDSVEEPEPLRTNNTPIEPNPPIKTISSSTNVSNNSSKNISPNDSNEEGIMPLVVILSIIFVVIIVMISIFYSLFRMNKKEKSMMGFMGIDEGVNQS
jgi:hypothetical protein